MDLDVHLPDRVGDDAGGGDLLEADLRIGMEIEVDRRRVSVKASIRGRTAWEIQAMGG
jgi:hypothetical protein